jgi:hypothetical protein
MERFRYEVEYVKGKTNKVSDALSRWFEGRTDDECEDEDFVNADVRLDPEGDDLPKARTIEMRAIRIATKKKVKGREEARQKEAAEMAAADAAPNPKIGESEGMEEIQIKPLENADEYIAAIKTGYEKDALFKKISAKPEHYESFEIREGIILAKNEKGTQVTCVPRTLYKGRMMTEMAIDQAHRTVGHMGARITSDYIRRYYWWPTMGTDVTKFVDTCGRCQMSKTSNRRPAGLLHSLPVPRKPWSSIAMDFVGPFPKAEEHDYLWVILCRLTSMVHLVPVRTTLTAKEAAERFLQEIVRLHGLPESIVSDRDSKFTSKFWTEIHRLLGVRLMLSTAFHPQTDGASERMIRRVTQILRAVVKPDQKDWVEKIPMVEFACNASKSGSSGFAPFELVYGHMPRMAHEVPETTYPGVQEFAEMAMENLARAHDAIIESRVKQTYHANKGRREDDEYEIDELVYLSTENLNLPKGRARKLMPKYIGPYKVLKAEPRTSHYQLELPAEMVARKIHPTFHAAKLRPHHQNDEVSFPGREAHGYYDFGQAEEKEWLVAELVGHKWEGNKISFHVQWDTGECTWEPYTTCKDLEALDRYLELRGVQNWRSLPKKAK